MRRSILIVGGYGKVGEQIARQLSSTTNHHLIIAGRSLEKARASCRLLNERAEPLQLELNGPVDPAMLKRVAVVIMCHEQADVSFAKQCLELGIHYVDISASYSWLERLEKLEEQARASGATAVLSVGFAPGLTNLMAAHAARQLKRVDKLEIGILLGLGEAHGAAAIKWLFDELLQSFVLEGRSGSRKIRNFTERRSMPFAQVGRRSCYRFNFSDQHTLYEAKAAAEVGTYLGFDVEWMNRILAFLQRIRATAVLRSRFVSQALTALVQKKAFGSSVCAIHVEATGEDGKGSSANVQLSYTAEKEAVQTAAIAASVADQLMYGRCPSGVHHIEQLFALQAPLQAARLSSLKLISIHDMKL